jgi:hypothetical protein
MIAGMKSQVKKRADLTKSETLPVKAEYSSAADEALENAPAAVRKVRVLPGEPV